MSNLETAMALLIQTFDKYAGAEGRPDTLNKNEVKALLQNEIPALLQAAKNQDEMDKLIQGLDFNGDAEVDFNEFVVLIAALTSAVYGRCSK